MPDADDPDYTSGTPNFGDDESGELPADLSPEELFGDRLFNALEREDPIPGSLLISAPDSTHDVFQRTIVFLVSHDAEGSFGLILNQMSDIAVQSIMPDWDAVCAAPPALYIGGPVGQDSAVILGVAKPGVEIYEDDPLFPIRDRIYIVDVDGNLERIAELTNGVRVFACYAGWAPGQLHDEIERGDWYVTAGLTEDIMMPARVDLWSEVLHRQPMPLPLYATYPRDVKSN